MGDRARTVPEIPQCTGRPAVLGWPADELSLFDGLPHVHHRHAGSAEPLPERNDQTGGCKVFNGKSAGRRLVFHVMGEGDAAAEGLTQHDLLPF